MDEWAELGRTLDTIVASGCAEVREDGEWLAELAGFRCELHRAGKNSIVHLWSAERNLTRRILSVKERSENRIVLEVQRFGRSKPGRLEFALTDARRSAGHISREQFRARLKRILAERFPDSVVESLTASPDLEHSFSGLYVRGLMREGARTWAFLAVSPGEDAATMDGILAFGILWLDWTRSHAERRVVEGLRLFVPESRSRFLRERTLALSPAARVELFEFNEADCSMHIMDRADAGNVDSRLVPRREIEATLNASAIAAKQIRALSSGAPEIINHIESRVLPGTGEVGFCFRGLPFARWTLDGVQFGVGDRTERLTISTEPALKHLIHELDLHRSPLTSETNHPLYRAAPERWIETLVLEDPARLDAQLDPAHLYSQVPALAAGDRGVLDLLGVTRRDRLVVIELKASEDIQMPIQAVDYWLRVRRHHHDGDFQRQGYFSGVELDPQPPLVWLVAPGFRFHPATDTLLKYLSPEIQVTRIGLNENWRRDLKIVYRQ